MSSRKRVWTRSFNHIQSQDITDGVMAKKAAREQKVVSMYLQVDLLKITGEIVGDVSDSTQPDLCQ